MVNLDLLQKTFPEAITRVLSDSIVDNMPTVEVNPDYILKVCEFLKTNSEYHFEQLMDVCGVDYFAYGKTEWQTSECSSTGFCRGVDSSLNKAETDLKTPKRFAVAYHLLSLKHNNRLRIRCFIDGEPPVIDSVYSIWNSADWFEREAFDLFGIVFNNHPDLRRLLTDYGFVGHPFRKDFPLSGNVEVHYDEEQGRVVYRPVAVEPRTLVPRVVRQDSRYLSGDSDQEQGQA